MLQLRELMQIMLGEDGHAIECQPDGRQALDRIKEYPAAFDVVITDHHMPVMNGLELVGELRRLAFPGKIVVFSSELSRDVARAYQQLDVACVLPKPIFPATLRAVLSAL